VFIIEHVWTSSVEFSWFALSPGPFLFPCYVSGCLHVLLFSYAADVCLVETLARQTVTCHTVRALSSANTAGCCVQVFAAENIIFCNMGVGRYGTGSLSPPLEFL